MNATVRLLRQYAPEPADADFAIGDLMRAAADEIEDLRRRLSHIRGCMLRLAVPGHPGLVHTKREDWNKTFEGLIVPPINFLWWERERQSELGR
jgi:hypothetical protein